MTARFPLLILGSALLLSSCGTSIWKIQLKDGRVFESRSKPEFQSKTGYYRYENLKGKDALLRAEEVLLIEHE